MMRTSRRKRNHQTRSIYLWVGNGNDYNCCAANVRSLALRKDVENMRIREISPDDLTTNRYNLMRKGFLNRKEVMDFVPCGSRRVDQIIENIRKDVKLECLENLDNKTVLLEES